MAQRMRKNTAKLKAFTLIENMVSITLLLLVFVGASYVFLEFSMLPKWRHQLKAQSFIEQDYSRLSADRFLALKVEQKENYEIQRKIDPQTERLYLVNYKVSTDNRFVMEKNYYYLKSE